MTPQECELLRECRAAIEPLTNKQIKLHLIAPDLAKRLDAALASPEAGEGEGMSQDLIYRLRERARIRRQIATRQSVQEGRPDRIADLLDEAAQEIESLRVGARKPNYPAGLGGD